MKLFCRWKREGYKGNCKSKIELYRNVRILGGEDTKRQKRTFKNMRVGYDCTENSAGGVFASASILATTIDGVSET